MTIRTRLTLWYSSLLATVIVVFGISLFSILQWAWRSQIDETMDNVAAQMQQSITFNPDTEQIAVRMPKILELVPYLSLVIQVRRADGTLAGASKNFSQFTDPFDADMLSNRVPITRDRYLGDTHALVRTEPLFYKGNPVGVMQILAPLTAIDAAMDRLLRVMLGVSVVALLLSFMVGSVIAGQALQPVEVISHAAKQITAADDLSKRIPYDGPPDELGELTATFNATLERLERLFNVQRRFVADVSHELRTPLTTIQGNLDLLKRFGNDPVSLEAMDSEVKRMSRLVGDLLLLAQADSGRLPLNETPVELGSLALEVFRQAKVLADKVELRLGSIDAVRVMGDADRLKQLLLNLVTNAIKYSPSGGLVTISVAHREQFAFIKVTDTGIGIPKEDLDSIFDRFYRVDKARSRQAGGTGLGLSIVQWIAEAHHGRVWAESELGKGSTFNVQLPSIDPPITSGTGIPSTGKDTRPRMPAILRRPRPAGEINSKQTAPTPPPTPVTTDRSIDADDD